MSNNIQASEASVVKLISDLVIPLHQTRQTVRCLLPHSKGFVDAGGFAVIVVSVATCPPLFCRRDDLARIG